jgi:hypothetical protein
MTSRDSKEKVIEKQLKNINDALFGIDCQKGSLKDFQRETVNRVDFLFSNEQNRVLVADEVGLGKTMVARGVIAKLAQKQIKKQSFKVVYICSNQSIAKQNIRTIDILNSDPYIGDARLSMQHLNIMRMECQDDLEKKFIQLIPLTPGTSFDVDGGGDVRERALIYVLLGRCKGIYRKDKKNLLGKLLSLTCGHKSWKESVEKKRSELNMVIRMCKKKQSDGSCDYKLNYPKNILLSLSKETMPDGRKIFDSIDSCRKKIKKNKCGWTPDCGKCQKKGKDCERREIVSVLRKFFARVGAEMLNPDLVIMDEFQRFSKLIQIDNQSDEAVLAREFIRENDASGSTKTQVLLLSATPYKLFSTIEELYESKDDDSCKEFLAVVNFLFEKKNLPFDKQWEVYSKRLKAFSDKNKAQKKITDLDIKELLEGARNLENVLYGGICRTERISVMDDNEFYKVKGVEDNQHLDVSREDIESYVQAHNLISECGIPRNIPPDYIKSCPYIMSFMENYVLKKNIVKAFSEKMVSDIQVANKPLLWLERPQIQKYGELPESNARLKRLKKIVFENNSEKLLWCPPTKPYYSLEGAYLDSDGFSKTLVFSAWEMVPRMLSCLVSYEEERRIRLNKKQKGSYFKRKRSSQLKLDMRNRYGKKLFSELYPSEFLANLYNPILYLNNGICSKSLIKDSLREKINKKLNSLKHRVNSEWPEDTDWYIAALIFLDNRKYVQDWLDRLMSDKSVEKEEMSNDLYEEDIYQEIDEELFNDTENDDAEENDIDDDDDEDEEDDENEEKSAEKETNVLFSRCLKYVENILEKKKFGQMPKDLEDFLVDVTMGSFATCFYRSFKTGEACIDVTKVNATRFGRTFIKNFNIPETMEVLDSINRDNDTTGIEKKYIEYVYDYCIEGCFQGMLDEYVHLLMKNDVELCQEDIIENMELLKNPPYSIDTFRAFEKTVKHRKLKKGDRINMYPHFAVCFTESSEKKEGNRKDKIRNAFNSPLRPFVLASTSIGQEGLDFHNYCRKIMHWNLPSNPVDLEQREGRINRYKCLSIRQNVAKLHGDIQLDDTKDMWSQLFDEALAREKGPCDPELIPYWVFGKNQQVKIERHVPVYPMSRDSMRYERLIKILSLYRLTLGQPNPEELLEYMYKNCSEEDIKKLTKGHIDLCPWNKRDLTEN